MTGRPKGEIRASMKLKDNPPKGLGFTTNGLDLLAHDLNRHFRSVGHPFKKKLTGNHTLAAKDVSDLYFLSKAALEGTLKPK